MRWCSYSNVTENHANTMQSVPAVVVGPSKLDGDFLSLQYEVNSGHSKQVFNAS